MKSRDIGKRTGGNWKEGQFRFWGVEAMKKKENGTLYFYGIPAYGHTLSNLYLAGRLAETGFRVVYYSAEPFREVIRENGCEYRAYPMDWNVLDLSDGERILKLYRLILQYTWEMLPVLLAQVKEERPCAVIFDSLALWGRAIGQICSLRSFAFYSIAAIDWTWSLHRERRGGRMRTGGCHLPVSPWGKGLGAYVPGFSAGFLRYIGEVPQAVAYMARLKERYGLKDMGLLPVLMNRGEYNLCGYSRLFQPGGCGFGPEYRFVGPLSVHRRVMEHNDFSCPDSGSSLIYISLGTIFNKNDEFLQVVIDQLGRRSGEKNVQVVLVWDGGGVFPENFIVRPFVNQNEIMQHAALFLTAGGMNSIHEALHFGVPCLLWPQQGEQRLNALQFERLGFGRILKNPDRLRQEALECMELKKYWNEKKRRRMTAVSMEKILELFKTCGAETGKWEDGANQAGEKETKGNCRRRRK